MINGKNILRDAGSFSYNTSQENLDYFSGASGHNTIQFDRRDQMPRIGRFLFGNWLKTTDFSQATEFKNYVGASAAYRDNSGVIHSRKVILMSSKLKIEDEIDGFENSAVLRWRLFPGQYSISENVVSGEQIQIKFDSSMPIKRLDLSDGAESIYYSVKSTLPVIELEFENSGKVLTSVEFRSDGN